MPRATTKSYTSAGLDTRRGIGRHMMGAGEYLETLLDMHEAYYDVERAHDFAGLRFEGYAEFHAESSQYVLAKRAKLWGVNTHEYVFFKTLGRASVDEVSELVEFMTTRALDKIELNPEHMTSYLTLVIIANEADGDVDRLVRATRFRKSFAFGLKGWADLRMALVDLSDCRIIANRQGEDIADTLRRCMEKGRERTS